MQIQEPDYKRPKDNAINLNVIDRYYEIVKHMKFEIDTLERIKQYIPTDDEAAWALICYICNNVK